MKLLIQRVSSASVRVEGSLVSSIGPGLCVLVGIHRDDSREDAEYLLKKLLGVRLFESPENGKKWDKSLNELSKLEVLLVSQFTLYQELKGHKPDFRKAMAAEKARPFYESFVASVKHALGDTRVKDGVFGAMMSVEIVNDGPVTIEIASK